LLIFFAKICFLSQPINNSVTLPLAVELSISISKNQSVSAVRRRNSFSANNAPANFVGL
ncbi:unnamed protein product, partial [Brugia timori]|uniref:Ovule protein n=1 Tax=Brugia timori TaxID=42155 RepID=A0A0R3QGP7_9BILA